MVLNREPALIAGATAVILQGVLLLVLKKTIDTTAWIPALTMAITFLAQLFTRQKVMPVATIKAAGFSPRAVKERAEDPEVLPHAGP